MVILLLSFLLLLFGSLCAKRCMLGVAARVHTVLAAPGFIDLCSDSGSKTHIQSLLLGSSICRAEHSQRNTMS
jgi:hypothetical protein